MLTSFLKPNCCSDIWQERVNTNNSIKYSHRIGNKFVVVIVSYSYDKITDLLIKIIVYIFSFFDPFHIYFLN